MKDYLMVVKTDCGEYATMASPMEIIMHLDMQDCTGEMIEVYKVAFGKQPEALEAYGCWYDFDNPLYIKVTDEDGNIEFDGYGTDH